MSGMMNGDTKPLGNAILQRAEEKIESQLTDDNLENYQKIVVAGMRAGLEGGADSILASLRQSADPITDAAKGAVSMVLILRKQAKGIMPLKAMVPAAMTLMLKALDFADRASIVKVGQEELVKATHVFTDFMFGRFGITKSGLASAGEKVLALTNDPTAMQKIQLKAGIVKHPDATNVTP